MPNQTQALEGIDAIPLLMGDDCIEGTEEDDNLKGTFGDDCIHGYGGNDMLFGGTGGSDLIRGGDGDDYIRSISTLNGTDLQGDEQHGDAGNDTLHGSDARDVQLGGTGNDTIHGYGGDGDDYIQLRSGYGSAWGNRTYAGDGNDEIVLTGAGQEVRGGEGDDIFRGAASDVFEDWHDWFEGEEGNDVAYGEVGQDRFYGGEGNDTLYGGLGRDSLKGGQETMFFLAVKKVLIPILPITMTGCTVEQVTMSISAELAMTPSRKWKVNPVETTSRLWIQVRTLYHLALATIKSSYQRRMAEQSMAARG